MVEQNKNKSKITDMALIITKDKTRIFLSAEKATALWLVYTGEKKGTKALVNKIKKIDKWYLNRHNAPESWIRQNPSDPNIFPVKHG